MEKKRHEIAITVISILTVIVVAVGVTFAYFNTTINGSPQDVVATTATIGSFTFDGGPDFTTTEDSVGTTTTEGIEPGWKATKTFSIEAAPSNSEQTVYVKMDYINEFKDFVIRVDGTTGEGNGTNGAKGEISLQKEMASDATKITVDLVEIVFPASTEKVKYTYTLTATLPETHENQNYDQGKKFEGTLYGALQGDEEGYRYYNNSNPNGTDTKPVTE